MQRHSRVAKKDKSRLHEDGHKEIKIFDSYKQDMETIITQLSEF